MEKCGSVSGAKRTSVIRMVRGIGVGIGLDLAELLRSKIERWAGDSHAHGVFFTDNRGFLLNKILAVRITRPAEERLEQSLFYSFHEMDAEDGFPKVEARYPFSDMIRTPKKHHLLFDRAHIDIATINSLFEVPFDIHCQFQIKPVLDILDDVGNKRERDRSIARCKIDDEQLTIEIYRKSGRLSSKLAAGTITLDGCKPLPIHAVFGVNAQTIAYVLEIFSAKTNVLLSVGSDRIKFTEATNALQTPQLEVLISKMRMKL